MQRKQTPNWLPLSSLPQMAEMIALGLEGVAEQQAALNRARRQPHVLDDFTLNRVVEVYATQRDVLWFYEEQLARWQKETLTEAQRREVERLIPDVAEIKKRVGAVLALATELRQGTIDAVLRMSDEEAGMAALSGRRSPPPSLPTLTVNGSFIREFLAHDPPCCALGMVEVEGVSCGLVALRPGRVIPAEVTDQGFRLGHSVLGTADYEVVHFAFEFYGFETYNVLVNPGSPLVKSVLNRMVATGDYFFFALDLNGSVTAFPLRDRGRGPDLSQVPPGPPATIPHDRGPVPGGRLPVREESGTSGNAPELRLPGRGRVPGSHAGSAGSDAVVTQHCLRPPGTRG